MKLPFIIALVVAPSVAIAGGFGPWTFGMTAAQIRAVTDHGPYDAFTNGDLETYNATLCGQKQNVQFYLKKWRAVANRRRHLRRYKRQGGSNALGLDLRMPQQALRSP